jgi:ribosome-interacting GTPase 1
MEREILRIEEEIKKTPKNKSTEVHLRILKSKLSKLREKFLTKKRKGKNSGKLEVPKISGDIAIGLLGSPSVGKSSFFNMFLGKQVSKTADYAFTTRTLIPGSIIENDIKYQLFDLPGLLEAKKGGRYGQKEVYSILKQLDIIFLLIDPIREYEADIFIEQIKEYGIITNRPRPKIISKPAKKFSLRYGDIQFRDTPDQELISSFRKLKIRPRNLKINEKISARDLYDFLTPGTAYVKLQPIYTKKDLYPDFVPATPGLFINTLDPSEKPGVLKAILEKIEYNVFYLVPEKKLPHNLKDYAIFSKKDEFVKDLYLYLHSDFQNSKISKYNEEKKQFVVVSIKEKVQPKAIYYLQKNY